ncbi:MAG: DNA recombination protein RmuC [Candidatus Omnitrophica bacterium]|nr:DNA recombination protein RmuC [Candidatus Omnitrophota bacterium]
MVGIVVAGLIVATVIIIAFVLKISSEMNSQINALRGELNQRLQDTAEALRQSDKTVGDKLKIFGDVANSLGQLQEANKQLLSVGQDISSLQELLRAPKFRGEIGETMLEQILSQVLPKDNFQIQHRFKTGDTVDAVIKLAGHLVPVDSKFSLENFKKMLEATGEDEKNLYRRQFVKDIKNRIDEISTKYILPDEGTFDFALMYIMAENVYYETIIKGEFLSYALSKKVIPVSPNTFYAYLQVICLGLRGMKIESNVKAIIASLSRLQGDLSKFSESFKVVGTHIKNASEKYTEAEKRLEKFSDKLTSVEQTKQIESI